MGNCLVTKLKGVVENDNLITLGCIKAEIIDVANVRFDYQNEDYDTTIKFIGCTYDGQSSVSLPKSQFFLLDKTKLVITGTKGYIEFYKYGRVYCYFVGFDFDVEDLSYTVNNGLTLENTGHGDISGLFDTFRNRANVSLALNNVGIAIFNTSRKQSNIYGDVTPIGRDFNISSFNMNNLDANNILTGTLDNLGYSAGNFTALGPAPYAKSISFSVENFVAKARKAGVTTKSINLMWWQLITVTFNGSEQPGKENVTLSWDASTITYDGVTINNSDIEP